MIEAWLLLPALGLAYLIAAPGPALRHLRQLAVAAVVTGVVSLSWMAAVSLVPAAHRPYADGSHDNSVFQQVFVYNGFGRLGDQTPLQLLSQQSLGINLQGSLPGQGPAPDRLLRGDLGRDTGWLLPAAFAVAGLGAGEPAAAAPRGSAARLLRAVGRLAADPDRDVLGDHDDQRVLHRGADPGRGGDPRRRRGRGLGQPPDRQHPPAPQHRPAGPASGQACGRAWPSWRPGRLATPPGCCRPGPACPAG